MSNKLALITGASSGIGKEIARKLANDGVNLIILSKDISKLNTVKKELGGLNVDIKVFNLDLSNTIEVETFFRDIKNQGIKIDYLVNNAGISTSKSFEELTDDDFDREIAVNLKGVYLCIRYGYELIKEGGSVVNIGSIRGRMGTPSSSPAYAAAKAGVINMTKSFAMQLAKYKIRVNCVAPGAVYPTEMSISWSEEKRTKIADANLLKRIGTPDDIADAVLFLLSDKASYITGHTLDVNGGDYMN